MAKKLEVTPKIEAALKKATDGAVQASDVSIYETISLNTLPLSKRGLFDKARVTENTLKEMANFVNDGGAVPLHTLHQQGYELPVGKTFSAEVFTNASGVSELRTLFYLPNTEVELNQKLDTDVINEVSVGIQAKHLNCSECGWDYKGEDATFFHLYDQQCANDHVIGEKGVHLILNGLDRFLEQSLVSLGAANGAKIQSRTKSLMGAENYDKLAASGITPEITTLYATSTLKEKSKMDIDKLIASLTDEKAAKQIAEGKLATVTASLEKATADLAASQAEVVALKKVETPEVATLQLSLETATKAAADARAAIHKEATRLSLALGDAAPAADAKLEDMLASIETNRTKMSSAFPVGGAQPAATGLQAAAVQSSFKGA